MFKTIKNLWEENPVIIFIIVIWVVLILLAIYNIVTQGSVVYCSDFYSQESAQEYFDERGSSFSYTFANSLDSDKDGIACEGLQSQD